LNNLKQTNNILSIVFSVLFIYGLFTIVNDFDVIVEKISNISFSVLILSTLIYFSSVILRYLRWKIIYKELFSNYKFNMLNETIIGYMANNLLPFRLGEIYRVNRIVKGEKVGFLRTLSTIFTERISDVLALILILLISLPFINEFSLNNVSVNASFVSYFVFFLILFSSVILMGLFRKFEIFRSIILRIFLIFKDLLSFFYECKSFKKYLNIFLLSLLIWIVESIVYFTITNHLITDISNLRLIFIVFIVCAVTNLSGIIPSLPGNLGNFEFFGTLAFLIMNVSSSVGATVIITVHLILFIPISILGFIIIAIEKISFKFIK